jgi:hypothetical protein
MNSIAFTDRCQQTWTSFFKANMNSLFQTALLLSADPDVAEHNIAASFENIDFSQAPGTDAFGALQESVVTKSILGGSARVNEFETTGSIIY